MGIRELYGSEVVRWDALKFGNPGNQALAQSRDLLVEISQSSLQNLPVQQVFRRVELL
jgi:hypothetical protein